MYMPNSHALAIRHNHDIEGPLRIGSKCQGDELVQLVKICLFARKLYLPGYCLHHTSFWLHPAEGYSSISGTFCDQP